MHRLPRFTLLVLTFTASGIILAQDLSQPYVENEVIVRFVPGSAAADRAAARNSVSPQSVRSLGLVEGLELVRSALDVPQAIATLTNNPNVLYVEPNYIVQPVLLPDDYYFNYYHYVDGDPPGSGLQWGLHNVGQSIQGVLGDPVADIDMPQAWDKIAELTGNADGNPTTRTVVAVIDTGTQWHHEDLDDNIWMNPGEVVDGSDSDGNGFVDDIRGWDFFSDDNDPDDESGHGTHTAGTVAAVTDNVVGVAGVCANCEIMAIRFLGPAGGSTADAISSLYYALENGAKVSNNSWGGGGFSQGLYDAIAAAGEAGHIFVAAAGNSAVDNDTSPHYPSAYALGNIISVAATTYLDQRARFS